MIWRSTLKVSVSLQAQRAPHTAADRRHHIITMMKAVSLLRTVTRT